MGVPYWAPVFAIMERSKRLAVKIYCNWDGVSDLRYLLLSSCTYQNREKPVIAITRLQFLQSCDYWSIPAPVGCKHRFSGDQFQCGYLNISATCDNGRLWHVIFSFWVQ